MAEERRTAHRVRIAGVRVTYESASGDRIEADALDLGGGGLFVRTAAPLAVGKRIALEIQVVGEPGPWSVLGRVAWKRDKGEGDHAPPGMGVKLIDADDGVLEAIEHLVESREKTEPGVGKPSSPPPDVPAPVAAFAPERERTLMGVGSAEEPTPPPPPPPPREQSVAIDLVTTQRLAPASTPPPGAFPAPGFAPAPGPLPGAPPVPAFAPVPAPAAAPAPAAKPADGGGGAGRWIVIALLLAVAGVAAYVLLDGFLAPPPGR
jgi:uncharacterized protein (TIGR02266 family)